MKASGGLVCQGVIDGENGKDGYNTVAVPLYRRSSSELNDGNRPSGTLTYTFSTGKLTGPSSYFNGWSQNIPTASANTKLYVIMAVARSQSDTDDIEASDWSTPVEYVKDGEKGDDAVVYELVPDVNVINANADGTIVTGIINIAAYRIEGSQRSVDILLTGEDGYVAQFAVDSSSWQNCTHEMSSRRSWRTYIPAESVQTATSRIRLRLLDGSNAVCGVCPDITIVRNGTKGDKGRMFYLAGTYDSTKLYQRTDDVCPIVYYENGSTKEFWYLDAVSSQDVAPSDVAGNPWKKAENFGLVITEALFANFGKLGSWVFSGDYMLSQTGVDGNTDYTQFTDENGKWKPVTLLDAFRGLVWFGGDKVRFQPDGAGWLANRNIYWDDAGNLQIAGMIHKKKTVITQENLSQYGEIIGKTDYNVNIYAIDLLKAGNWIELNGLNRIALKFPSIKNGITYQDGEEDLARSLVGNSVILHIVNCPQGCYFTKTSMDYYYDYNLQGERHHLYFDADDATNYLGNNKIIYMNCVDGEYYDEQNNIYYEDVRWIAKECTVKASN